LRSVEVCKEGIKAPTIRHFKVIAHDATDVLTSFLVSFFLWKSLSLWSDRWKFSE